MSVMQDVIRAGIEQMKKPQHGWLEDRSRVCFELQDGPIEEAGSNGADPSDLIRFAIGMYADLNRLAPCRENALTITKLQEALHWQMARDEDRTRRGVEGTSAR